MQTKVLFNVVVDTKLTKIISGCVGSRGCIKITLTSKNIML